MRVIFAFAMLLFALAAPVLAQTDHTPWQASVTGQIEAFRAGDGATALTFAGEAFRTQFEGQPEAFYAAIAASGYAAIIESRSHSFGTFEKVGEDTVLQVVKFVAPDQSLYEAAYQLRNEPGEGWRVIGVALRKAAGIAI
ncbi:protein of unknown function [Devosia sp. YR412]|uniref:DUF4864 domain-containing protein n=1 Tax=Devosia sp. YR412 TaxID=1881030 RepID=UPI0008D640B2|nr:DUF4864 domain-containing protein [Devosia sp. YR412]SEQ02424.1 protein of unknown function [Devosia sp. YR412]